jgi:UDP-glucose 4-epimerase
MKILLTWWAWFVASNMTKVLLEKWHSLIAIDNFILGKKKYIEKFLDNPNYQFIEEDLLNKEKIFPYFQWIDLVIHLAANSDISKGVEITDIDLKIWTIVTYNILECMRIYKLKQIIFASTSAVYGMAKKVPTWEDDGPMFPISLYGASKLACEALVSSFWHNYNIQWWIFRFGNVIGRNSTHGAAYDFVHKLKKDPTQLVILGNGKQAKPYIYIDDLIDGILFGYEHKKDELNYFNLTPKWNTSVAFIAESIINYIWLKNVTIDYTWWEQWRRGDVPQVQLDNDKLKQLWWSPRYDSNEAVVQGTKDIVNQIYFWKEL